MDNSLIQGFRSYLVGKVSMQTINDYVSAVSRREWPPNKRSHIRAWRKYVGYLFSIGIISWEKLQAYRLFLYVKHEKKTGEKRIDEHIIVGYVETLRNNSLEHIAYLLLGGARLSHIVYVLNNYEPGEKVKHPHGLYENRLYCNNVFCRYYLGIKIGSKKCDYIYYPYTSLSKQNISYRKLRDRLRHLGVQAKLFRKYVNQTLEQLAVEHNIRLDAVNMILSRELSVTGGHYLDTRNWSDKLFSIYVEYLKKHGLA